MVILDNVSTPFLSGVENEADRGDLSSVGSLQHRRAGRAVILIHHAGKEGTQRGTSRREDVLDLVLQLKLPNDADPTEGARFEVHFENIAG